MFVVTPEKPESAKTKTEQWETYIPASCKELLRTLAKKNKEPMSGLIKRLLIPVLEQAMITGELIHIPITETEVAEKTSFYLPIFHSKILRAIAYAQGISISMTVNFLLMPATQEAIALSEQASDALEQATGQRF